MESVKQGITVAGGVASEGAKPEDRGAAAPAGGKPAAGDRPAPARGPGAASEPKRTLGEPSAAAALFERIRARPILALGAVLLAAYAVSKLLGAGRSA